MIIRSWLILGTLVVAAAWVLTVPFSPPPFQASPGGFVNSYRAADLLPQPGELRISKELGHEVFEVPETDAARLAAASAAMSSGEAWAAAGEDDAMPGMTMPATGEPKKTALPPPAMDMGQDMGQETAPQPAPPAMPDMTAADRDAEAVIARELALLDPTIPLIAEEAVAAGTAPTEVGDRFWLVDPLDGTREFLRKNGEFTVNIALIGDGVPTVAVVGTPAKGMLHASDGDRAFRRGSDGTLKAIAARVAPADGVVAAVSRSHRDEETNTFLQGLTVSGEKVGGSSLKFCLVAEGEADVYPRFGRPWSGTPQPATPSSVPRAGVCAGSTIPTSATASQASRIRLSSPGVAKPERMAIRSGHDQGTDD